MEDGFVVCHDYLIAIPWEIAAFAALSRNDGGMWFHMDTPRNREALSLHALLL